MGGTTNGYNIGQNTKVLDKDVCVRQDFGHGKDNLHR